MTATSRLADVLAEAQRIGLIGPGPLDAAILHAGQFARLIPADARVVMDLGSGGGLPGLVVATERADLQMVLVDRRQRSTDFLRRATHALGLETRTEVVLSDAVAVAHDPAWRGRVDVVTARGVAPPARLAELALPLLAAGGRLLVSEAAGTWPERLPAELGSAIVSRHDGLVSVVPVGEVAVSLPRRKAQPALF